MQLATAALTAQEQQMLQELRARADELARMIHEANAAGFTIQFNINGQIGACDVFNVFKMVPIDLRASAN